MIVGDIIVLENQSATITGFFTTNDGVGWLSARWHDEQDDGNQVVAVRLDAFNAEQVMLS